MGMAMESIITKSDTLRALILAHPDYKIAVLAGECANGGDYTWQFCSDIDIEVGRMLNVKTPYDRDEYVFHDEDDFKEHIEYVLMKKDECKGLDDAAFDVLVESEAAKYADGWEDVIFIYATNP